MRAFSLCAPLPKQIPHFIFFHLGKSKANLANIEQASAKAKESVGLGAKKAEGTASEVAGEAKGKASEVTGEAKGKAQEVTGKARGKAEEVKGKL